MPNLDSWEFVCRTVDDIPKGAPRTLIPPGAAESVSPELLRNLGRPVSDLYPEFAKTFRSAAAAMAEHYGKPMLALSVMRLTWIHSFLAEGRMDNILFGSIHISAEKFGADFDRYHAMLPVSWVELYRWFDSFSVSERSYGSDGLNTPTSFPGRMDMEELREACGDIGLKIPTSAIKSFQKKLDPAGLRCWMYTDAGDTLWIDEEKLDRRVYHARIPQLDDVEEIVDTHGTMDRYLAHVIAGHPARGFDFRRD